ncbi:MAG: hypothetical protein IJQ10_00750 [Clostridia bacterium]|nr:hypothetical protein [Clostridia bacterium]
MKISESSNEESKNGKKGDEMSYDPLGAEILKKLLKESKGIETLWKKIKDNKDKKKIDLYKCENELVELVAKFTTALAKTVEKRNAKIEEAKKKLKEIEEAKKSQKEAPDVKVTVPEPINLGKNLASKEEYNNMVTQLLKGDTKVATAFIKKFPHWTIQVGSLFANSIHYKRITSKVSGSYQEEDIDSPSNFNVMNKSGNEKIRQKSKKGFFKSISSFFNKYIKRGGMGKASKSKVTIELAKFGEYVNEPWRKWWETVAESNFELSKKQAKEALKSALSNSTASSKARLVCLFNTGVVADAKSDSPYVKLTEGDKKVVDVKKGAVNQMYQIFKAIDAKLGNKAEALFSGEESAKNLDTNDDKIKRLIELHKIFYTDKKAIRFSEVFDKLGIKTSDKPEAKAVEEKVNELFEGSTFSNDKTALDNVKKLAEDARNFLKNYYDSDKTNRLLYELKFLGSCFKINDLNKVESVDQAINVLNRLPKNTIQVIQDNDQEVAKIIEDKLQESTKSITSLDEALKGLKNVDFNKPEGQNKLLAALTAIVTKGWIEGVTEGKFPLVDFINKLLAIENRKYESIAEKIQNMGIYKENVNKNLADFIDELKKSLKQAETKKIEEQNKQIEEKIQTIEKLFEPIKSVEADYNGGKKQLKDPKKGQKIITAIKQKINYKGKNNRTDFLKAVAQHIGINDTKIVDKIAHTSLEDLKKFKVENSKPHLLLRKIRNLIAYGIFGNKSIFGSDKGNTGNTMPDDLNEEQKI